MSPVLVPSGFTRDFLDGKIALSHLEEKILSAFTSLKAHHDFLLIEGTGHCGVGSILGLNNARVAQLLKVPIVLIASGGLGSAFDSLALNKGLCDTYGVPIVGVILNRVRPEKKEMIQHYMRKALQSWNIPLLGCIPFDPMLSHLCMKDLETLFHTTLITGKEHRLRHFMHMHLVATHVDIFDKSILPGQLIITPAAREDIITAVIKKHWEHKEKFPQGDLRLGLILTGERSPSAAILDALQKANLPMLYITLHSDSALQKIHSFTAKIRTEDVEKIKEAIEIASSHINFKEFLRILR
jgi:BioD-like phosphotransacetylase family protein